MQDVLMLFIVLAFWYLLQVLILPRLGVDT